MFSYARAYAMDADRSQTSQEHVAVRSAVHDSHPEYAARPMAFMSQGPRMPSDRPRRIHMPWARHLSDFC